MRFCWFWCCFLFFPEKISPRTNYFNSILVHFDTIPIFHWVLSLFQQLFINVLLKFKSARFLSLNPAPVIELVFLNWTISPFTPSISSEDQISSTNFQTKVISLLSLFRATFDEKWSQELAWLIFFYPDTFTIDWGYCF